MIARVSVSPDKRLFVPFAGSAPERRICTHIHDCAHDELCSPSPRGPSTIRPCAVNTGSLHALRHTPLLPSIMFAAASSFFARTNISQSYNIGPSTPSIVGSRTASPAPSGSSAASLPAAAQPPPFTVGPWRVQPATHKVTGKRVSIWSADKKSQEMERMGPASRERTLEVLKAEVRERCSVQGERSALSAGIRHPR